MNFDEILNTTPGEFKEVKKKKSNLKKVFSISLLWYVGGSTIFVTYKIIKYLFF